MAKTPTRQSRSAEEKNQEEEKKEIKPKPMVIDTSAVEPDEEEEEEPLSNSFTVCLLYIVHTFVNGMMLSAYNPARCLFWKLGACPPDLDWITTWLSVGHLQVALLLSFLAKAVHNKQGEEAKLSYLVLGILAIHITSAIASKPHLHRPFLMTQLTVWTLLLVSLGWFSYTEYDAPSVSVTTPSRGMARINSTRSRGSVSSAASAFSTASLHSRSRRFSVVSVALAVLAVGALIQAFELVLLEDKNSYYSGSSANMAMATGPFQNSADMVIVDKWIVTVILAATLRFFDYATQRNVLMGKTGCLMLHLIVLTSDNGALMETDARKAAGVGAFFMVLTAVVGIL